jgi:hypothetical protein
MSATPSPRQIVQITSAKCGSGMTFLYALCADGSVWGRRENGTVHNADWRRVDTSAIVEATP